MVRLFLAHQANLVQQHLGAVRSLSLAHAKQLARRHRQVAHHVQMREEHRLLKDHAAGLADLSQRALVLDRHAVYHDVALVDRFKTVDAAQQRGFAGAAGPQQHGNALLVEIYGEIAQYRKRILHILLGRLVKALDVEALGYIFYFDHSHITYTSCVKWRSRFSFQDTSRSAPADRKL